MVEWVTYAIGRGPIRGEFKADIGLTLTIKALPAVEEFMKTLSGGRTVGSNAYEDGWVNQTNPAVTPNVYTIDRELGINGYSVENVGGPLFSPVRAIQRVNGEIQAERTNISMLKLVGISEPEGVTIGIVGIYSQDYINKIRQCLIKDTLQFLRDYLVPVSINLQIVSKNG